MSTLKINKWQGPKLKLNNILILGTLLKSYRKLNHKNVLTLIKTNNLK